MECQIGVGLYSLTGVYGHKDLREIERMLIKAVELGIEYFDVADQYGPAEEVLGRVLHPYRSRLVISTKAGLMDDGSRDCSYQYLLKACENSLMKLKSDYIDIYLIHFDDPNTPVEESICALEELQKRGWIMEYGISHLSKERIMEYGEKGSPGWLMLELNPISLKTYIDLSAFCLEKGIKIITMGSTGRGLLAGKIKPGDTFEEGDIRRIDPLFQRGIWESSLRVLRKLQELGRKYEKTSVQVALNWIGQQPGVYRVLVGPSTVAHLQEDLGGLGWSMTAQDYDDLHSFVLFEAEMRKDIQEKEISKIISGEFGPDRKQVVADVVYVLNGLVELGKVKEKEVIPLFYKIMSWEKKHGGWSEIKDIKEQLVGLTANLN